MAKTKQKLGKKKAKSTRFGIFDHLNNLTVDKKDWDENNDDQVASYTPYMINKWISMNESCIPLVNRIERFNLPKDVHYRYLFNALPKRKLYFDYVKKQKEYDEKVKECVCRYFEIGPRQLDEYLDLLTEEQVEEIVEVYRHGTE